VKCRWIKLIDSLGSSEPDEGVFTKLPNGDDLETGSMPCAERGGAITEYEEVWRTLKPVPGPKRAWILQSVDGKTFLGRIGGGFMALSERAGGFSARSEQWSDDDGWRIKYAIGELKGVPSFASIDRRQITGEADWKTGGKAEVLGVKYIVRAFEELE
jgi:hypothetical protein